MKVLLFFVLVCSFFLFSCKSAKLPQEEKGKYLSKFHLTNEFNLPYRIIYPSVSSKKYPLLIFLHGSGERGTENEKQLVHGSEWIRKNLNDYPMIAIFPQCPTNDFWSNVTISTDASGNRKFSYTDTAPITPVMKALISLIEAQMKLPYVDQSRIYVMGLSMGGMATYELMWRMPGKFAAAVPICGGGATSQAKAMALTGNTWIFHGDQDEAVPVQSSRDMNAAITKYTKNIKYTEYPGVHHNSWDNVFLEPDFFKWMFSSSLKNVSK
jgi:predicted peptidase